MSKTPSIPLNRVYQIELLGVSLLALSLIGVIVWKSILMFKPAQPIPPANMQLIQLQNAVNLVIPPEE